MIKTDKRKIDYCQKIPLKDRAIKVECKLGGAEDTANILCVNARIAPVGVLVSDNSAKFTAKALFSVVMGGNSLSLCEGGVEFSADFNDERLKMGDKVIVNYTVERTTARISNGVINAECYVLATAYALKNNSFEYLCGGEDLLLNNVEVTLPITLGCFKGNMATDGEEQVNRQLKNVVASDCRAYVTGVDCNYGIITVTGYADISLIGLPKVEDSGIIYVEKKLPFSTEIDAPDVTNGDSAIAQVVVKTLKIDAIVDQDKNETTVTFSVTAQITATAYRNVIESLPEDCFSTKNQLTITKGQMVCQKYNGCVTQNIRFSGEGVADQPLAEDCNIIATAYPRFTVTALECANGQTVLSGVAEVGVFSRSQSGAYGYFNLSMPVEEKINGHVENGKATVVISNAYVSVKAGKLIFEGLLNVYIHGESECEMQLITAVEIGEEKQINDSAISIYYLNAGCSLWQAVKQTGVCGEELFATVGDFPLQERKQVVVYRQR